MFEGQTCFLLCGNIMIMSYQVLLLSQEIIFKWVKVELVSHNNKISC